MNKVLFKIKLFLRKRDKGQMGLILSLFLLSILGIMAISFLYKMRIEERASFNYKDSIKANYLAQAGIERAIAELKNDNNEYDDLYENWAKGVKGELGEGIYNVVEEENKENVDKLGIFDEASKINLNTAGNEKFNQGWTTYEVNLGTLNGLDNEKVESIINYRYGKDASPGKKGVDDDKDNNILQSDGIDNDGDGIIDEKNEGIDEPDEFCPDKPYGDDNPFDTIEEVRLVKGIGETTFNKIKDYITVYSYDKNVDKEKNLRVNINISPASTISQALQKIGISQDKANQIAVNIVDFRDENNSPTEYKGKYGIERTPYINEVMPHFTSSVTTAAKDLIKGGISLLEDKIKEKTKEKLEEKATRIIENEIEKDTSDKEENLKRILDELEDNKETVEKTRGVLKIFKEEKAEAAEKKTDKKAGKKIDIDIEMEWIELFNPYDTSCKIWGWQIKTSLRRMILWGEVPARGYRIIFNMVIKMEGETIGKELLNNNSDTVILIDTWGNIVDKVSYDNYGAPWNAFEKNDPRARKFVSSLPGGSPGFRNWFWMPTVGEGNDENDYSSFYIKNKPFANIGEVGYIHKGKEWQTIKLQAGGDWQILDKISIANPPVKTTKGRININTASRQVLKSLPGIDSSLANAIINYGNSKRKPFNEIGELLEIIIIAKLGYNGKDDDGDGYIDEDDEKEMIFRSLSNLITTRSNCFTVTSLGQIKKLKEIISEKKIKVILDRGAHPLKIKYYKEIN
ncbi:general secretion pathway protein GspK [Candidatus Aerophobetes bacterium]|nr:general secretion pathway protein GspK [Candidatus Aerophobetes bacterium]